MLSTRWGCDRSAHPVPLVPPSCLEERCCLVLPSGICCHGYQYPPQRPLPGGWTYIGVFAPRLTHSPAHGAQCFPP